MHAASVNPEPGSNSLKNCISTEEISSSGQHLFQSYFVLASFLLFRVFKVFFNEIFTQSCVRSCFKILLVVQFSKIVRRSEKKVPLSKSARLLYITFPPLSTPFLKVFWVFSKIFFSFCRKICKNPVLHTGGFFFRGCRPGGNVRAVPLSFFRLPAALLFL